MLKVSTGILGQPLYSVTLSNLKAQDAVADLVFVCVSFYCEPLPNELVRISVAPEHKVILDSAASAFD